jgi:predicted acyl esterase
VRNGIDTEPQVNLQLAYGGATETLSTWPAPELRTTTLTLGARGALRWDFGCFCWKGVAGTLGSSTGSPATDSVNDLLDTTASTGPVPILSPLMESIGVPVTDQLATILPANGVRYEGATLSAPLRLRGAPHLVLRARPSQSRGVLVAYLYDADPIGFGTLVSHGARAVHWATPGVTTDFGFDLDAIAYDVPAGHHLALVFDTADSLYGSPVHPGEYFSMALPFDAASPMTLSLPVR